MQKKYWGIIVAIYLLNNCVFGQSLQDTVIALQEVQVIAKKDKYLVGAKIEKIDSLKLESVSGESLADIINSYLPIYIKQDAGGLATIRMRGTSSDHTAVMFNGININSLTLGHSNVSSIPAFLFDDIKVQYGSSSSLYGTDAIGGSIQLNNKSTWDKGFSLVLQQDIGSFHSYFSGIKIAYSGKKFSYSLKGFRQKKKNDFPFLNTAVRDFEKDEYVSDTLKNAAIENYGILQEMSFKLSEKIHAYVNLWYEDNWHQIQPNMSTNYHGGSFDEIENKHLRFVSGFSYYEGKHKLTTDLGYVYDYQLYNKNNNEIISTNTFITNLNYFNTDFLEGDLNAGFNYFHIRPDVYAYDKNLKEDRVDVFLAYKKTFFNRLTSSLNIRETIVVDFESQFTPSIGFNYSFLDSKTRTLNGKMSISRSYKIPTFNDRFWIGQGNPDLFSEKGMNYEIGAKYQLKNQNNSYKIGVSGFFMNIDDWIQWIPDSSGIWRPQNKDNVHSKGVELSFETIFKISNLKFNTGLNYSLNKVILINDYVSNNSSNIGKQIFYTPEHIGKIFFSIDYRKWIFLTSASYTGERYSVSYDVLKDYFLLNASIAKNFKLKKHTFSFNFKINNILNKVYQNQELYAMPGRNYALSIKYLLNK